MKSILIEYKIMYQFPNSNPNNIYWFHPLKPNPNKNISYTIPMVPSCSLELLMVTFLAFHDNKKASYPLSLRLQKAGPPWLDWLWFSKDILTELIYRFFIFRFFIFRFVVFKNRAEVRRKREDVGLLLH